MTSNKFLIGTSGWSYPDWQGAFYPDDCPRHLWFDYYARIFSTVEVNATFYRFFNDEKYGKWRENAPDGFKYIMKVPRVISHIKLLRNAEPQIKEFSLSTSLLQDRLGLLLLEIPPDLPYNPALLRRCLLAFEDPKKVAVEFQNEDWLTRECQALLKETGAVYCNADSPYSDLQDWVTSENAAIHLQGRKRYAYDYSAHELREISELAERMSRQGAKKIYIIFSNDFEGQSAKNAMTLQEMLK